MNLSNNISKALAMSQKISEQMAAFDKINSAVAKFDSLKIITCKNVEGMSNLAKIAELISKPHLKAASNVKFYGGSYTIPHNFSKNQGFVAKIPEGFKFYGGGNWQPISSKAFLLLDNNKYEEIDTDVFLPKDKVKFVDNWFKSLELNKSGSIIRKLNTLDTIRSVAEQNVIEKLNSRYEIADRISNILCSIEGSFQVDTKLNFEEDTFTFHEYNRFYDSLCYSVSELISDEAIINSELAKIELLNRLYISIKACLKKVSLNKREIFRKINSFHFKNLDDYHSISLVA